MESFTSPKVHFVTKAELYGKKINFYSSFFPLVRLIKETFTHTLNQKTLSLSVTQIPVRTDMKTKNSRSPEEKDRLARDHVTLKPSAIFKTN